jgi:hypothetical protein
MNDITRKEELISCLDRTVNKWRKLWRINQDEKEASQTIRFITQFYNRENVETDAITRNVLTILWKKRLAQEWDLNPAILQSINFSVTNYTERLHLLESKNSFDHMFWLIHKLNNEDFSFHSFQQYIEILTNEIGPEIANIFFSLHDARISFAKVFGPYESSSLTD